MKSMQYIAIISIMIKLSFGSKRGVIPVQDNCEPHKCSCKDIEGLYKVRKSSQYPDGEFWSVKETASSCVISMDCSSFHLKDIEKVTENGKDLCKATIYEGNANQHDDALIAIANDLRNLQETDNSLRWPYGTTSEEDDFSMGTTKALPNQASLSLSATKFEISISSPNRCNCQQIEGYYLNDYDSEKYYLLVSPRDGSSCIEYKDDGGQLIQTGYEYRWFWNFELNGDEYCNAHKYKISETECEWQQWNSLWEWYGNYGLLDWPIDPVTNPFGDYIGFYDQYDQWYYWHPL